MYQAICPDCGATITLNVPGDLYAGCPECQFYGWVPSTKTAAVTRPLAPIPAQVTPLTDEQMKAIRAMLAVTDRGDTRFHATQALLAEVERLRAREAALVAVVQCVAMTRNDGICPYCKRTVERHTAECPVVQARALLAASEAAAGEYATANRMFICLTCGGRWREDELGPTSGILRCSVCGDFCEQTTAEE